MLWRATYTTPTTTITATITARSIAELGGAQAIRTDRGEALARAGRLHRVVARAACTSWGPGRHADAYVRERTLAVLDSCIQFHPAQGTGPRRAKRMAKAGVSGAQARAL